MARVLAAMQANVEVDRRLSAKAAADLTFGHGAHGTREAQACVVML